MTSGGDFFGGSQVALTDVLGDQNFLFTALSVREFRSYEGTYVNLPAASLRAFRASTTRASSTRPYILQHQFFSREGVLATQRYRGRPAHRAVPLDKFRRLELARASCDITRAVRGPELPRQLRPSSRPRSRA